MNHDTDSGVGTQLKDILYVTFIVFDKNQLDLLQNI